MFLRGNEPKLSQEAALFTLAAHHTTPRKFDHALLVLKKAKVQIGDYFWADIINDETYPAWQRQESMLQLFSSLKNTSLSELGALPHFSKWFDANSIAEYDVDERKSTSTTSGKSVYSFVLYPRIPQQNFSSIIMRLQRKFTKQEFINAMTGNRESKDIYIRKVTISEKE